jgi:hypothetical protein
VCIRMKRERRKQTESHMEIMTLQVKNNCVLINWESVQASVIGWTIMKNCEWMDHMLNWGNGSFVLLCMFAPRLRFLLWKPPHKLNHDYYKNKDKAFPMISLLYVYHFLGFGIEKLYIGLEQKLGPTLLLLCNFSSLDCSKVLESKTCVDNYMKLSCKPNKKEISP